MVGGRSRATNVIQRIGSNRVYDYDDGKYVDFKTRPTSFVQKRK